MLSTQQLVLMHSLGFSCIADTCASYVQARLYSGPSYKKDSTVRAETPPHSALQRETFIMAFSAPGIRQLSGFWTS